MQKSDRDPDNSDDHRRDSREECPANVLIGSLFAPPPSACLFAEPAKGGLSLDFVVVDRALFDVVINLLFAELRFGRPDRLEDLQQEPGTANALASAAKMFTFAEAAATYIASHRRGLKNLKYAAQWATTIATYAEPLLGNWGTNEGRKGTPRAAVPLRG
jgi:hypothetical protein